MKTRPLRAGLGGAFGQTPKGRRGLVVAEKWWGVENRVEQLVLEYGLGGLFVVSFLAATFLPVVSEVALVGLLLGGLDPWRVVLAATAGNTLGSVATWGMGRWCSDAFLTKVLRLGPATRDRAKRVYARFGPWSLLLAWTPFLGDPLCAVAGLLGMPLRQFVAPVLLGKFGRYVLLAFVTPPGA